MSRLDFRSLALTLLLLSGLAAASEDHLTTDFQQRLQPNPGVQIFYVLKSIFPPSDVSGSSVLHKYGIDVAPSKYFDIYVVGQNFNNDLQRTNRFKYDLQGSNLGVRLHLLREEEHWLGLTVGANWEKTSTSPVFRNGVDLGIANPDETAQYFSLLLTKPINEKLRVNAGMKLGEAEVGTIRGSSNTYAAGLEYDFSPKFGIQGNYKRTELEGLPGNDTFALNLKYRPSDWATLQLNADLYTNGVTGFYPAVEPLIPSDYRRRFSNKATGAIGFTAAFAIGQGSRKRTSPRDTLDSPVENEAVKHEDSGGEVGEDQKSPETAPEDSNVEDDPASTSWKAANPYFSGLKAADVHRDRKVDVAPKTDWRSLNPHFSSSQQRSGTNPNPSSKASEWRSANPYFR